MTRSGTVDGIVVAPSPAQLPPTRCCLLLVLTTSALVSALVVARGSAEPTGAYPARPIVPETSAPAEAQVVTSDNPDEYRDMPVSGDKSKG